MGAKDEEGVASQYEDTGTLSSSISEDLALEIHTTTGWGVSFMKAALPGSHLKINIWTLSLCLGPVGEEGSLCF